MFKFMKSKKGFTLVELMIVVVIMAILVAVAVPIFSAVTANAKKKTCIGNQREIVSSVGNWLMLEDTHNISGTFSTKGGQDAPNWNQDKIELAYPDGNGTKTVDQTNVIEGLFKTVPVCPDSANNLNVYIVPNTDVGGKAKVFVCCSGAGTITVDNAAGTATFAEAAESNEHIVPGT